MFTPVLINKCVPEKNVEKIVLCLLNTLSVGLMFRSH